MPPSGTINYTITNSTEGSCDPALPITWLNKTSVKLINGKCIIVWSVANQINNEKFIIEHSRDGSLFQTIGEISGDGNNSGIKEYKYMHDTPSKGINYYRVKQVDYDGKSEYSNVASVVLLSDDFLLYPNPAKGKIMISSPQEAELYIYNGQGRMIKTANLQKGENQVDITDINSGMYYLITESGQIERIIKP